MITYPQPQPTWWQRHMLKGYRVFWFLVAVGASLGAILIGLVLVGERIACYRTWANTGWEVRYQNTTCYVRVDATHWVPQEYLQTYLLWRKQP